MKRRIICLTALLLAVLFFPACKKQSEPEQVTTAGPRTIEQSAVWTLNERYPLTYSNLKYFVTYLKDGEPFCLQATRNKKATGMSNRVRESREIDGIVFALCEGKKKDNNGNATYTFYECYTGSFRYYIGRESDGFFIENILSMDDAIALMASPESPRGSVELSEVEWNAEYRTDACDLQIMIRPNDVGALTRSLSASYQTQTEGEETYYVSASNDEIVYTDGQHSVQIRQANRAGKSAPDYHTLSECKAILALLG